MRETRQFEKRPIRHTQRRDCQVVAENDFRLVADQIENLSTFGMLAGPADPAMTGELVYVSFQLPGTTEWFDAKAIVTRVVHGRRPGETSRKLGLEFVDVRPFDQYRLRRALGASPAVPPSARRGRRKSSVELSCLAG